MRRIWPFILLAVVGSPGAAGGRDEAAVAAFQGWAVCVRDSSVAWSTSPELAATIVAAAFGRCRDAESRFRQAQMKSFTGGFFGKPPRTEDWDSVMRDARQQVTDYATSAVMEARSKAR